MSATLTLRTYPVMIVSRPVRCLASLAVAVCMVVASAAAAADRTGEQIYAQQCARCHGAKGQGVKKEYGKPLAGDRSIQELTAYIAKSMPEDDPGTCTGDDARKVSAFIYDAFYSPIAQARNQPVRIELARLTVRQYRNALADLMSHFRGGGSPTWDAKQPGLRAEYFKNRRFGDRKIERTDPVIDFDFGEASPDPDQIEPVEFSIRWNGSLLAPETGLYEFNLSCENGARAWVNDTERPLIDAWVKSGNDRDHRATIFLIGGRPYPLRVEFFKSKEGKEKTASIALRWTPPHRAEEVVPARNLSPRNTSPVFVISTPFPPDDRSLGYERGTAVSQAWEHAVTDSALETAAFVVANVDRLANVKNGAADRPAKLKEFCKRWTSLAFRRPLTDDEKQFYVDRQFEQAANVETAVQRVVLLTLMSPRFLYHDAAAPGDAQSTASRLALTLWDTSPDQALIEAAGRNQLGSVDQVRKQAERMLNDLRTRSKLHEFFVQWLNVDRVVDLAKDQERFPEFDDQIVSDLRAALDMFLDEVAWGESSDFRQLLLADWLYMNGELAQFYGLDLPADAPFQKVTLDKGQRAGVLTHPYIMAEFAYTSNSSPIHRGVFVARSVLGRALRPPPEAVAPTPPELQPDLTTRERVVLQTKGDACQSCHRMINPLGFAFENFDAVGRYRKVEQGKLIDATGAYQTREGKSVKFKNVRELATYLANSEETRAAFVEQLFQYLVKQPIRAYGPGKSAELQQFFVNHDLSIRKLVVEIAVTAAMPPAPTTSVVENKQ